MKKQFFLLLPLAIMGCGGGAGEETENSRSEDSGSINESELMASATNFFQPLPEAASFESPKARLGKSLYYETRLSVSGELSCNSCHLLDNFGVDNEPTSPGHDGTRGERNSPTTYNAWFHLAQFWDGRAADLVEQAKGPILNPVEMGMATEDDAIEELRKDPEYQKMFAEAFPDEKKPINFENVAIAIAEFEKTLRTPSPFDRYLKGDQEALTTEQKEGLDLFIQKGCITCHIGPGVGGSLYQKFGLMKGPYWEFTDSEKHDEGRASVTGNETDKYFFKVPALRNVAKTGPYFHDGSVADLGKAIQIMAKTQLNKELSPEEVAKIKAFLESLTGSIPEHAKNETSEMASL